MTFLKMYKPFWGGVAFSFRVTLDLGTPYFNAMVILPSICYARNIRALSHKETGLGFSAEQRVLL